MILCFVLNTDTIHISYIIKLASWQKDKVTCLMCMEADPDRCYRKNEIAERLKKYGVPVNDFIAENSLPVWRIEHVSKKMKWQ